VVVSMIANRQVAASVNAIAARDALRSGISDAVVRADHLGRQGRFDPAAGAMGGADHVVEFQPTLTRRSQLPRQQ
jgi:hypothetical protein